MANKEIKFEALEQYRKEKSESMDKARKLHARAEQAEEKLAKLKLEYENVVKQSLDATEDKETELLAKVDELAEQIEKQQAVVTRRKAEAVSYGRVREKSVTRKEVQDAFKDEFKPQFREERVQPILNEIADLKVQLIAAMQELEQVEREYEGYKSEVWSEVGQDIQFDIFGSVTSGASAYLVTTETLHDLDRYRLPQGVKKEQVEKARKALSKKLTKEAK